jgi:hypothetical protein
MPGGGGVNNRQPRMDENHRLRGPFDAFIIRPAMADVRQQSRRVVFNPVENTNEPTYATHLRSYSFSALS